MQRGDIAARLDSVVWEGEERADMWGPHVSDRGERRRRGPEAQIKRESALA
jgi:hypothetical protein